MFHASNHALIIRGPGKLQGLSEKHESMVKVPVIDERLGPLQCADRTRPGSFTFDHGLIGDESGFRLSISRPDRSRPHGERTPGIGVRGDLPTPIKPFVSSVRITLFQCLIDEYGEYRHEIGFGTFERCSGRHRIAKKMSELICAVCGKKTVILPHPFPIHI